jgi:ankyrin repeat protein
MSTAPRVFGMMAGIAAMGAIVITAASALYIEPPRPLLPDINGIYGDGWTALMDAAWARHLPRVRWLLDKGADVNVKGRHGWTALMSAADHCHVDIAKLLVAKGADVHAKSDFATMPLKLAKKIRCGKLVGLLKAHGAKE